MAVLFVSSASGIVLSGSTAAWLLIVPGCAGANRTRSMTAVPPEATGRAEPLLHWASPLLAAEGRRRLSICVEPPPATVPLVDETSPALNEQTKPPLPPDSGSAVTLRNREPWAM